MTSNVVIDAAQTPFHVARGTVLIDMVSEHVEMSRWIAGRPPGATKFRSVKRAHAGPTDQAYLPGPAMHLQNATM